MPDEMMRNAAAVLAQESDRLPPAVVAALEAPTAAGIYNAAEALLEAGRLEAAETLYQGLLERPGLGPAVAVGLARVATRRGDDVAAAARWRDCIDRFPDRVAPQWLTALAQAERRLGRDDRAEAALDALVHRFPDHAAGHAGLAELAAQREAWGAALDRWTACLAAGPDSPRPGWLNGRAQALFRLWRIDEAFAAWRDTISRHPDFLPALNALSRTAAEAGDWATVRHCACEVRRLCPDRLDADWLAREARALAQGRAPDDPATEQELGRLIAELERRFPDSPLGRRLAADLSLRRKTGIAAHMALIEDALRRYPNDRELAAKRADALLGAGRLDEAEPAIEQLEAAGSDHWALVARWRLLLDRDGEATLQAHAPRALAGRRWPIEDGLALAEFLLGLWSPWAADLALGLMEDLDRRHPGRISVRLVALRALIALGRDEPALALIDAIPDAYLLREVLELRAWAQARRGNHEAAARQWQTLLATQAYPAVHATEPTLELVGPEPSLPAPGGVIVFAPVRDEAANLPAFLAHYRGLGARRFVFVDNMSEDGSDVYLAGQPDVVLYRTSDRFAGANHGMRWINALIDRHGGGGWCLFADADEAFVYPGCERLPLDRLVDYLEREGAEAVEAFMLDLYPERLSDAAGAPATHADCRYHDGGYTWIGHPRMPYRRPLGGARARLFGAQEYLHKVPLIKASRGVHIDNHETTHLRLSGVTGALLHYKILDLARRDAREGPDRGAEEMRRYERYARHLAPWRTADLRAPGVTRMVGDSFTLVDQGLMTAPEAYRAWLGAAAGVSAPPCP
ncbi:MAG TPA: glycosyltransferase family 2 protein [Stellaceae bacterium]|nr:glycosyltransferase family 2 protein [Stellaceae bacterium]